MQMAKKQRIFGIFRLFDVWGVLLVGLCTSDYAHTCSEMYTATAFSSPVCTLVCTLCTCVYMLKK